MRIATDTRGIEPGDAFLALWGERHDGHDFVGDAFARGAVMAIVARSSAVSPGKPAVVVGDTLEAYKTLGGAARVRSRATFIAITGSTGKTTTKAFLAQILGHAGRRIAATPLNENNEIGVSKLLVGLNGDEDVVVVEMGCRHYGEIADLVRFAKPDLGVLTNIGEAHLEIMGTRERIAETKWGLFAEGARAILNLGDEESRRRSASLAAGVLQWYGAGQAAHDGEYAATLIPQRDSIVFTGLPERAAYTVAMHVPGEHNLTNLAGAAAAARCAGLSVREITNAIPSLVLPPGRYERIALGRGVKAIYDAYNASMSGTLATLRAFAGETASRRIAVLGGMAELGPQSAKMHEETGAAARNLGIDVVLAGGTEAAATARGARDAGMRADAIVVYPDNAAAIAWLRENLRDGDAVLLKGSRMYKMEQVLAGLRDEMTVEMSH